MFQVSSSTLMLLSPRVAIVPDANLTSWVIFDLILILLQQNKIIPRLSEGYNLSSILMKNKFHSPLFLSHNGNFESDALIAFDIKT